MYLCMYVCMYAEKNMYRYTYIKLKNSVPIFTLVAPPSPRYRQLPHVPAKSVARSVRTNAARVCGARQRNQTRHPPVPSHDCTITSPRAQKAKAKAKATSSAPVCLRSHRRDSTPPQPVTKKQKKKKKKKKENLNKNENKYDRMNE